MATQEQIQTLVDAIRSELAYLESTVARELDTIESALDSDCADTVEEAMDDTVDGCMTGLGGKLEMIAEYNNDLRRTLRNYVRSLNDQSSAEQALKHRLQVGG